MANKIIHKRSSIILSDGEPKLPTADGLEYGELAINFAKGAETISFKNNSNTIVEFRSKEYIDNAVESVSNMFTINTTNDINAVSLSPNSIVVFNNVQTFATKTFNLVAPTVFDKEYTYTLRFKTGSIIPTIVFNAPSGHTLRWANGKTPVFTTDMVYEITFKYMPGLNIMLGVWGGF